MFIDLQNEILARILASRQFFLSIRGLARPNTTKALKGLMFVQLYAVYSYTVVGTVKAALQQIN
jgi:hypothetical protein